MNTHAHALWMVYLARGRPWRRWAVAWGVMPDLMYVPLIAAFQLRHGFTLDAHLQAWDWAWLHPLTFIPHSLIVCGAALAFTWWRRREWFPAVALGWGSHVLIDACTHVSDAYPLFWPLSDQRFPSVISYWEKDYFGREFFLINHVLLSAIGLVLVLRWYRVRVQRQHAEGVAQ